MAGPMKGIVFTELVSFLEQRLGAEATDAVLNGANLPNGGAFTTVGNYPAAHALVILDTAAAVAGVSAQTLCEDYGSYLFSRLSLLFPAIIAHYDTAEALLSHIASHIHEEVVVLYPDAKPPHITTSVRHGLTEVHYVSHRPLAHLAYGLTRQCLAAFADPRRIRWLPGGSEHNARFLLEDAA